MPTDPPLHGRHRDKNGEISRKHGNTLVRTLRRVYGQHFAEGCNDNEKLADVLHKMHETSLSKLVHDHEHGHLAGKIAAAHAAASTEAVPPTTGESAIGKNAIGGPDPLAGKASDKPAVKE